MMNIVVNFGKCSETSITASNKIAVWLSSLLKYKLIDDEDLAFSYRNEDIGEMIIVNGMTAFCDYRDDIVEMARSAKQVIWIGNDYTLPIPSELKFIQEKDRFYRFAVYENFNNIKNHTTIDFNRLLFSVGTTPQPYSKSGLFYYGAFRKDRISSFKKYLKVHSHMDIHISTSSKNIGNFLDINPIASFIKPNGDIKKVLPTFQSSLYITDNSITNGIKHKPANRFYECVGSKVLLFFDETTVDTFDGMFDMDKDWVVSSQDEIFEKLKNYDELRAKQISVFEGMDYKTQLEIEFLEHYEKIRL